MDGCDQSATIMRYYNGRTDKLNVYKRSIESLGDGVMVSVYVSLSSGIKV